MSGVVGGFQKVVRGAAQPGKVQEPRKFCDAEALPWGWGRRRPREVMGPWGQRQGNWDHLALCYLVWAVRAIATKQPQVHIWN